jgi:hypothetical protein
MRDEVAPAVLERAEESGVVADVGVGGSTESIHVLGPSGSCRFEIPVRTETRDHASRERVVGRQSGVGGEVVGRVVGSSKYLDAKAVQQGTRPECVHRQPLGDLVVDAVGSLRGRARGDIEDFGECALEPITHRRAAEDVPVLAATATRDGRRVRRGVLARLRARRARRHSRAAGG